MKEIMAWKGYLSLQYILASFCMAPGVLNFGAFFSPLMDTRKEV